MKRYDVLGDRFDFFEAKNGDVIFYDDFVGFISARIKDQSKETIEFLNEL